MSTYNIWDRKDGPPARDSYTPPSGNQPSVWHPAYTQTTDNGGRIITKAELDALLLNDQDRANKAYDYNGVANKASKNFKGLYQYGQEDDWIDHLKSFN